MKTIVFYKEETELKTYECDFTKFMNSVNIVFTDEVPEDFEYVYENADKMVGIDTYEDEEENTVEETVFEITDFVYMSKSIHESGDNTVTTYTFKELTYTEKLLTNLKERVSALELSQEDQDEAILDLANEVFE